MRANRIGTAGALLVMGSATAVGAQPDYSFIELEHQRFSVNVEEGSLHQLKSVGITGSWQVIGHLALVAEARRAREDADRFDTNHYPAFGVFKAGATTFWSMFGVADLYVTANYDFGIREYGGELGLRSRPINPLEFHVALNVDGLPRAEDRRTASGMLEFGLAITPTRSLTVGVDHSRTIVGDDIGRVTRIFMRYNFARD
jgi:hypothetical protein